MDLGMSVNNKESPGTTNSKRKNSTSNIIKGEWYENSDIGTDEEKILKNLGPAEKKVLEVALGVFF